MQIIDNINKTVKDDLQAGIHKGSKMSVAAACFSIYAYQELKKQLDGIDELRFIFTSPTFVTEKASKAQREFYIPRISRECSLYGTEFEVKLRNELTQKAIAKECADWIRRKVVFKSNVTQEQMMGFMTVDESTYMPINGFTTVDLGCERGNNAYYPVQKTESFENANYFLRLFEQLWNDKKKLQEVTDVVIENISVAYRENAPEYIYFVALYNIFKEFLEDVSEDELPNEATGFKESKIWGMLYNFQRDAVLAIISKLEKFNGCILADSVGLGKTFTALAVIKYYENRNKSVLVLCPKKLSENWNTYKGNYINNPIATDRLRYDVLYHTDLSREHGQSNGIDLDRLNWGNYDLVVIDESHNFRNGGEVSGEDAKENRYLKLLNKVVRAGVKTKVLMLSATPVNNKFIDLKNQLALAYEGDASQMSKKLDTTKNIDEIFRQAQKAFNAWSKLPADERTTDELLRTLDFDFFELLDSVTIDRIKKLIDDTIGTIKNHQSGDCALNLTEISGAEDFDYDDQNTDFFSVGKKVKIDLADMDYVSWMCELEKDAENLELLSLMIADITPEHDTKLQTLFGLIRKKIEHPINPGNKKIIIFTAFSDTADYLFANVSRFAKENFGLETAEITGTVDGKTTIPKLRADLNTVLTCFSPVSKGKSVLLPGSTDELDILIATDCISEGQNLQDCDYLINYDIHWNPVRIIQRFGRIDRIGSRNDHIQLVNFWPDMDLDEYINLKSRVETRMKISVMTSTGDDDLINAEEKGDLEYRRAQLKRLQEEVVDIEDMTSGISIMDLGLNEFRLDLLEYMKQHEDIETAPKGLHTVVGQTEDSPAGVIFVLRNINDSVNIDNRNRIHPFYMVYISEEGEIVCDYLNPKKLLDTMRLLCRGKGEPCAELCKRFNDETDDGRKMSEISELLSEAINSIIDAKEENDIDSLFKSGGTSALLSAVSGLDDFELICFLVVK